MTVIAWIGVGILALVIIVFLHDVTQKQHAIIRNFPVVGHFRYLLEAIGPELRQYIVTANDEERPFTRDERRWIYASAKGDNNFFGFGTDNDLERTPGYVIIRQAQFPVGAPTRVQAGEHAGLKACRRPVGPPMTLADGTTASS